MSFISQMSFVCVKENTNKFMIGTVNGNDYFYFNAKFSMNLWIKIVSLFVVVKNKYIMMKL